MLRSLLLSRQDQTPQLLRLRREQGEAGRGGRGHARGALCGDDADSLAGTRHETDVVDGTGHEQLDLLLPGRGQLVRLQLKNVPDLVSAAAAGSAAGVCRVLLFAVDLQVGLQVVQAGELQAALGAAEGLLARVQNAVPPLGAGVGEGFAAYTAGVRLLSPARRDTLLEKQEDLGIASNYLGRSVQEERKVDSIRVLSQGFPTNSRAWSKSQPPWGEHPSRGGAGGAGLDAMGL